MSSFNVTTSFDTKTRVLTAQRGKTVVSKKTVGIVIPSDHGRLAADLILAAGAKVPARLVNETAQQVSPNSFKFHVEVTK